MITKLSKRAPYIRTAQLNSSLVTVDINGSSFTNSKELAKVIIVFVNTLLNRVKPQSKQLFKRRIKNKFYNINLFELAGKKLPPTATIGNAITIVKQLLMGQDPVFINEVMGLVIRYM